MLRPQAFQIRQKVEESLTHKSTYEVGQTRSTGEAMKRSSEKQGRSQACASGVAELSCRNHVVHLLGA